MNKTIFRKGILDILKERKQYHQDMVWEYTGTYSDNANGEKMASPHRERINEIEILEKKIRKLK